MLVGSLTVAAAVATVVVLTGALAKVMDPQHYCETGFSKLVNCTYHWSSKTISQSTPIFSTPSDATNTIPSGSRDTSRPIYVDVMSWAVADCPRNYIARRLLCATPSDAAPAQASDDDPATGLPRPKPWLVTTAKNSTFIKAFHVETPLDLAGVLRFYRHELSKRGWSENGGAVVEPGGAVIAFTTSDGPALLRLTHQDDRTIVDLSLRKPAATDAAVLPMPGQVRLLLGNSTNEEAVITINEQTIELAAGAELTDDTATGRKSPESQEINLPPGKYKVSLKIASGVAQNREFEVAADETWGLVVGPAGVPIPLHLY
ncbi:hypothetical protein [Bradyrhizobium sp. LTSP885]|uniref:hypothetical protein n=1 Tax=Bradyrhizobium sp. LTSP885 TaxID=1619232 RepID=UPI0012E0086A|nr:hypothetical protein [Bradyrhizobium sp. LTSP885]